MKSTEQAAQQEIQNTPAAQAEAEFVALQQEIALKAHAQMKEIKSAGLWDVWQANTNYRVRESIKTLAKNIIALKS